LAAHGLTTDEIALRLNISVRTAQFHFDCIRTKLGGRDPSRGRGERYSSRCHHGVSETVGWSATARMGTVLARAADSSSNLLDPQSSTNSWPNYGF
jgi:DNA-binding NarL/FixJ family response regulator